MDQMAFTSASLAEALGKLITRKNCGSDHDSPFYVAAQRLSARLKSHPKRPIERAGDILERTLNEVIQTKEYGHHSLLVPRVLRMTYLEYLSPFILVGGICSVAVILALCLLIGGIFLLVKCFHVLQGLRDQNILFIFPPKMTQNNRSDAENQKKTL